MEPWTRSIATGEPFDMVFPLKAADGSFHPFLTRVQPLKDDQGRVLRWFGTNTDVTEQNHAEERLQLLLNELNHRVKNTLATVQAIASQSFRTLPRDAAPERRGSDYCGNKRRVPPEGFLRRRENCAQREKPCCRSRAGNRLLWPAS